MITYWQQIDGKLVKKDEEDLDTSRKTWVDARSVTRDDLKELEDRFHIDQENLLDVLDPDELSRIEKNDEEGYILTIVRLPVFSPSDDISYFTAPLGIITTGKFFITVCWTDCEVLKDFAANRIKDLDLNDFPAFTIRFLSRSDTAFLRYLKEINRRATTIQNEMLRSVQNHELIQLLNIQKSLTFFSTSLKSNQLLLEKMRKTRLLKLDEEDQDWLDDVEIDNRQAMEMTDTYTEIMTSMNEAFGSVLSNNLNIVMKTMTAWNLVLMIPTFVTSFFGSNVPLPWDVQNGWKGWKWAGFVAILGICAITGVMAYFLFMKRKWNSFEKPQPLAKRKKINKQKKFLMAQEKLAQKKGRKKREVSHEKK